MQVAATPEIRRCNLNSVILQLKSLGVKNIHTFPFLQPPKKSHISKALQRLVWLGSFEQTQFISVTTKLYSSLQEYIIRVFT